MNEKKKKKGGVSVLDAVIVILILALVGTALFRDQIRRFLGDSDQTEVEYTFLIKDVTDSTISRPLAGESITLLQGSEEIGTVLSVEESPVEYRDEVNGSVTLYKLTCTASALPEKTDLGYEIGGTVLKRGAQISAKTQTASFQMTVIDVKELTEEA